MARWRDSYGNRIKSLIPLLFLACCRCQGNGKVQLEIKRKAHLIISSSCPAAQALWERGLSHLDE